MAGKFMAYVLTAVMTLSLALPPVYGSAADAPGQTEAAEQIGTAEQTEAAEQAEPAEQTEAADTWTEDAAPGFVWQTDIRMSLKRERKLREAAGLSLAAWDEAAAIKKQEGREAPLTKEAVLEANPEAQILDENGAVYYIDGADALGAVGDGLDAYRAAYSAAALMGGSDQMDLRLWQQMDVDDVSFYSFQQISDSTMVLGSTMKLAVKDGKVLAVFSSLDPEAGKEETLITAEQAENTVREKLEKEGNPKEVIPAFTDRIRYTPVVLTDLNLDEMDDDPVPEELRWVVFTENEDETYPFTAHYLDLAGQYIESLDVEGPESDEALCGFRKQKIFDGMQEDTWTGEILGEGDVKKTVTLPIMRDGEGRLYLGDVVRRIAVADFAKAVYDDDHTLELVQSDANAVFDNEDLYMYYNYLNAWDFYADMGWISPDGEGSDVVILKGLCTGDGTPFENACSLGMVAGWQMFGYASYSLFGEPLRLARGLDVMAHEYTHTFTSTIMNSNLYENDQGAINEAMSDIMGNLIEFILKETDDTLWLLGENTGDAVRNMSDPEACEQPSYVWDKYYGPQTDIPNAANDRGGVHANSSLLNRIAAKLCLDSGMPYEDAVRFFIMTAGTLTPKTDYSEICASLRWAAEESGNEAYASALDQIIKEEHLDREEIPEKLPVGRKIVRLSLPDNETFNYEYWALVSLQLNLETVKNTALTAFELAMQLYKDSEDAEAFGKILSKYLNSIHLDGNKVKLEKTDDGEAVADAVADALYDALSRTVGQVVAWRSRVGEDIVFVSDDSPSFYILLALNESGTKMNGAAALIGDRWVNLSPFIEITEGLKASAADPEGAGEEQKNVLDLVSGLTEEQWESLFDLLQAVRDMVLPGSAREEDTETETETSKMGQIFGNVLNLAVSAAAYSMADEEEKKEGLLLPAKTQYLPTEGLEKVQLMKPAASEETHAVILATSDMHGNIWGYSYEDGAETDNNGMARLSTYIKQVREEYPAVFLVDAGDAIQGTIMTDDLANKSPEDEHPVIAAMNAMGYDAMTVGNHEFNWGVDTMKKILSQAAFPVLSMNILNPDGSYATGEGWTIIERGGVKLAVIGVCTPDIPIWDDGKQGIDEMTYEAADAAVKKAVAEIGDQADIILVSAHMGQYAEFDEENGSDSGLKILEENPEVDILQVGHMHITVDESFGEVPVVGVRNGGREIARIDVTLDENRKIKDISTAIVDMADYEPDEEIRKLNVVKTMHEKTLGYVAGDTDGDSESDEPVGMTTAVFQPADEITGLPAGMLEDTAVIDLILKIQMLNSGADVSGAALFKDTSNLPEGPIYYNNIFDIYKFDNTLYRVNVTGAELKAYMEKDAAFYNQWVPGDINISFDPEHPGYRYDMFAGVDYEIDISKPAGERIKNVMYHGEPLKDDEILKLAISNYRYSSTLMTDQLIKNKHDWESSCSIRDMIVNYFRENSPVEPTVDHNWRIVGIDLSEDDPRRAELIGYINEGLLSVPYEKSYNLADYDALVAEAEQNRAAGITLTSKEHR